MNTSDASFPNPYARVTGEDGAVYGRVRPEYPIDALRSIWVLTGGDTGLQIVDFGAGTGKLTGMLNPSRNRVIAVEPAPEMRRILQEVTYPLEVLAASAECSTLPEAVADLVTYGQCWHWLDEVGAAQEAHRVLRLGGHLAVLFNQLDVSVPWVHRLTRITRSGDVHRPDRPPVLGAWFTSPQIEVFHWEQEVLPAQIQELAKTRAAYLRAGLETRHKMQENLRWYLYEHLKFHPDQAVKLPYQTLLWTAQRR